MENRVVSHEELLKARLELVAAEKEFTRQRDALTRRRMAMPWERVEKRYQFEGPTGALSLAALFDGRSQLIVYHFMFAPEWEEACKSCSFWADNFNGIAIHLNHRDVTFTAVSRTPLAKIDAYKKRMGWSFPWISSYGNDFSFDYQAEELIDGRPSFTPAITVFHKDEKGEVFHTYSCFKRGIEIVNGAYQFLDLVPKGRDEEGLSFSMAWVCRHDQY
jgi:predicted dithiol-disulfide oxidoreductase (DUF899 family)